MSMGWADPGNYFLFESFNLDTTADYTKAAFLILFLAFIIEAIAFERFYTNTLRPKLRPGYGSNEANCFNHSYECGL